MARCGQVFPPAARALPSIVGLALLCASGALAQSEGPGDPRMSPISGDVDKPRRHFRLSNPAALEPTEAANIYTLVKEALARGYARSGHAVASQYQDWRRYNTAPYLSTSHGNHYLNNYANAPATAYGAFEAAGELPVGSVIAKDSFSITEAGEILLGPLFVMEKMQRGFNYAGGDWRYSLIMPNGTLFGETRGRGAQRVEYCISCHLAAEMHDHLFFVPKEYRSEVIR